MHLTTLIEDTPGREAGLVSQHGLSLLIEAGTRTVLFDMGQDGTFIRNAEALGLDLSRVDAGVLSHGHYDHGGGLGAFLDYNKHAPVYLKPGAGDPFYARDPDRYRYIGLEEGMLAAYADRLIRTGRATGIFPGFMLFSEIQTIEPPPPGNGPLLIRKGGQDIPDPFLHELFLVVEDDDGISVITGCGHSGIMNMISTARDRYPGQPLKAVVGGFHLIDRDTPPHMVRHIASALKSAGCRRIITGHCTGSMAKEILQKELGDCFSSLSTGYHTYV